MLCSRPLILAFTCALLLGCADQKMPIFGDWYGYDPLPTPQGNAAIELVLDGHASARHGRFRLHRQAYWAEDAPFDHADTVEGEWTMHVVHQNAKRWRVIELNAPELALRRYVLLKDNFLTPANPDGSPNMGEGGWKCCRLAPRARGSFGFGRV